jgi:RND family efflux transporter MFP subunit
VTVDHPRMGQLAEYLEFSGNTQAVRSVKLRARVEGYLEKVLFKEGDIVDEGQLLFRIQQNTYHAKLKKAEATLLSAKAKRLHARTEFKRFTGLLQEDAAAHTDVDRWQFERDAAEAEVMSAEAEIELARLNLDYTEVRAPFRGRVSRRYQDIGNLVGAGEDTVLAEINLIDPIYAYFTINEQDLLEVMGAQKKIDRETYAPPNIPIAAGLGNESGFPHPGRLDYAGIQVDETTGTLQLRATLPNPDYRILPGLFVRIRAEGKPQERLLLPEAAIGFDQRGAFVMVLDDRNIVARRGVVLGTKSGQRQAILSGVTESDRVIVNGLMRAVPGQTVKPVGTEPAPESGKAE